MMRNLESGVPEPDPISRIRVGRCVLRVMLLLSYCILLY